jgi:hypothetical protein
MIHYAVEGPRCTQVGHRRWSGIDAYRKFQVDHLTRIKEVQSVKTEIPMQKIKLTSELPI